MTALAEDQFIAAVDGDEWEPLSFDTREVPQFPVDVLPPAVAAMVRAVSAQHQTPPDLAGWAALGALSAVALGASVDCGQGWTEPSVGLYLLLAMPSGGRKSTVMREMVAPVKAIERERMEEARPHVRELESRRAVLEIRKKDLQRQAAKGKTVEDRAQAEEDLREVCEQLDAQEEPVLPRLLTDDITPEALAERLSQHGSMAVLAAESAFIDNLVGRYSDKQPNLHLVCSSWSGEESLVDRTGKNPRPIDRPLMAILLCVQPHVLERFVKHDLCRAQGFVARFAYSQPENRAGHREFRGVPAPPSVVEDWEHVVRRVAASNGPLTASSDAIDGVLREAWEPVERRQAEGRDLADLADWAQRHHGRIVRIAAILHLCTEDPRKPIGAETMRAAVAIGDYLLEHGIGALSGPDPLIRRAFAWLRDRHRAATVTKRDLHRGPLNSARGRTEDAVELAERLVNLGALRPMLTLPDAKRHQGPTYEVHPGLRGSVSSVSSVSPPEPPKDAHLGTPVSSVSDFVLCKKTNAHLDADIWRPPGATAWQCVECYRLPNRPSSGIERRSRQEAAA